MSITITTGIQKGGASKTSTAGIITHFLSEEGKRVLTCDLDCQGNLTELMSGMPASEFNERTVLQAIIENDATKYVYKVSDRIDLLPADNLLAMLPRHLYQKFGFSDISIYTQLRAILEPIKEKYDYIIIDTPPALSEHTVNALVASDFVVVLYESSQWCYSAIPNFMGTVELARQLNPSIQVAGILRTLNDIRRFDSKSFNEMIEEEYPELVFQTMIKRKAATGRISLYGFENNSELAEAIDQYKPFYQELMERVHVKV